ncbi:MAG: cytidylate kinase, partial [Pedosphaera sp.]|nr:cytidylate kinase [Pedosphaera sp.]
GVKDDLAARDERDRTRAAAPLQMAADAILINNAGETPQQTSERMLAEIRRMLAQG